MDSLAMMTSSTSFSNYIDPVNLTYHPTTPSLPFLTAQELSSISSQPEISSEDLPEFRSESPSEEDQQDELRNQKVEDNRDMSDYFRTPKQRDLNEFDQLSTPSQALNQIFQNEYNAETDEHDFQATIDSSPLSHLPHLDPTSIFSSFPPIQPPNQAPSDYDFKTPEEQQSPCPSKLTSSSLNVPSVENFQLPYNTFGLSSEAFLGHHHQQGNHWSSNALFNAFTDGIGGFSLPSLCQTNAHFIPGANHHHLINDNRSPESTVPSSYNSSATSSPLPSSLQLPSSSSITDFLSTPEPIDHHNYHHLGFNHPPSFELFGSTSIQQAGGLYHQTSSGLCIRNSSHRIPLGNKGNSLGGTVGKLWHPCPKCGKLHSRLSNLHAHVRDTHSDQKKVFCDVLGCNKAYKRVSECRRHKKDMHGIPLPSELAGKTRRPRRIIPRPEY